MKKRSVLKAALTIAATVLLASAASAETTFHSETPGAQLSASDAAKRMTKKETTFRCRSVRMGKGINPVSVPNSSYTWHAEIGKGLEDAASLLADGKKTVKCETVMIDPETARVRKSDVE